MSNIENNNEYRHKLKQQLIEAHGKVVYTYTAHHKMEDYFISLDQRIRLSQIILTAISTGGFLGTLTTHQTVFGWDVGIIAGIIAGISSALSLALNLYSKDFRLQTDARVHKDAADELWNVKEDYVSLITDIDVLSLEEVTRKRDMLKEAVNIININYPGTDERSYRMAQKALKEEEEQTFNIGEAEKLLPTHLREARKMFNNDESLK